ncbi:MAG: 1-deoxy-D-xylulose-5-phosphate synthase [Clostridia bacterium]|nr:1-deoxy-D-xylulose-5-phosphate synthase [Clostridia bacterium]
MLDIINKEKLKSLDQKQIGQLSDEIRQTIINTVSKNGGHLASNLGLVEATIALHRVFDFPNDTLIFDVGHQAYTHKLLTGRYSEFSTLRQFNGLSGFTNREESNYDFVTAGHSGTALSIALGKAEANRLQSNDNYVVVVIGDGSFTNGMTFEALDACASSKNIKLVIVLNDNEMSISKNVGGLSNHFSRVRSSRKYYDFKRGTERVLAKIPLVGKGLAIVLKKIKDIAKRFAVGNTVFDSLGINYMGTVDGNNESRLEEVFTEAKRRSTSCIIHITTKKGKGYSKAEERPDQYHSVSPFELENGLNSSSGGFSQEFGNALVKEAEENDKICAITAAMRDGTGLTEFAKKYPDRFFDVGIAEEHGATFSAGLALSGYIPVFAVYSTFSQRIFDQVIHDVSLQKAHVIFALDRAGLVPQGGVTHHGVFDVAMLSCVPNINIYSPSTYDELRKSLHEAISGEGAYAIRYPKGKEIICDNLDCGNDDIKYTTDETKEISIITYGRITNAVIEASKQFDNVKVVKLVKILPLDVDYIQKLISGSSRIIVFEEGMENGGIGEKIASNFGNVELYAINDFVPHGDYKNLDRVLGFDKDSVSKIILKK